MNKIQTRMDSWTGKTDSEENGHVMLELFQGTRSISRAFERNGWKTYSVEIDTSHPDITYYGDVYSMTAKDMIDLCGGRVPDVLWASPVCDTYSVAQLGHHRYRDQDGKLRPRTEFQEYCDTHNAELVRLITQELKPRYWFIENPRQAMRVMDWMQGLPRYTITYCLAGETEVVTDEGVREIRDLAGKEPILLTSAGWKKAPVRCYGVQPLMRIVLSRVGRIKEIFATPEHRWLLKRREVPMTTAELKKGMRLRNAKLPTVDGLEIIPEFVARGFAFGDGYILSTVPKKKGFVMFQYEKKEMMGYFDGFCGKPFMHNAPVYGGDVMMRYGYPRDWKTELPSSDWTASEKFSWVAGLFAADGSVACGNGQCSISSSRKEVLVTVRDRLREIGMDTYSITEYMRKGYGNEPTPLYQITLMRSDIPDHFLLRRKHKEMFVKAGSPKYQPRCWTVVSVEMTDRVEDVYCAEVEGTHDFTLNDGILTHNCQYGDTRQKPTDIWTNHPDPRFKPPCKPGSPCHVKAPRGTRNGTQGLKDKVERARIPDEFQEHIVEICGGRA